MIDQTSAPLEQHLSTLESRIKEYSSLLEVYKSDLRPTQYLQVRMNRSLETRLKEAEALGMITIDECKYLLALIDDQFPF